MPEVDFRRLDEQVLNPVRARVLKKPEAYAWSSFRVTAGRPAANSILSGRAMAADPRGQMCQYKT